MSHIDTQWKNMHSIESGAHAMNNNCNNGACCLIKTSVIAGAAIGGVACGVPTGGIGSFPGMVIGGFTGLTVALSSLAVAIVIEEIRK